MESIYDEFSKSLAASVPRRQSLRLLGAAIAGAVFSPWGTAWAARPDPCKSFCNRCANTTQRDQCLAACQACHGDTARLGGYCGGFVCCQTAACSGVCSDLRSDPNCGACGNNCRDFGETCCGNYCADLANDVENCGKCGTRCDLTGPYEYGTCVEGACVYKCVEGAENCGDGTCTYLGSDPNNCGACGNVCPESAPYCDQGVCSGLTCASGLTLCSGVCVNILSDASNCGACGNVCYDGYVCSSGACVDPICQFYDC